ncbi:hypothetical protein VTN77DRAFT_2774 [Rasamsonia byssochlamydoides]|uniref:uncharacterized protein n=1 Tax=Rasamsonia byssochlamydoides TaxID=89139 RepID=UPI003743291A
MPDLYLAVDPKGFRAISPVTNTGQKDSKWLGNPGGVPKMRLVLPKKYPDSMMLKGGFDGFKMVSLGFSSEGASDVDTCNQRSTLRDTAQWFPDVPDDSFCLNETAFREIPRQPLEYRPLTVLLYGGPQGVHLNKLIGITVWIVDFERIYGIDFAYNTAVDGQKVHTLGRSGPFSDAEPRSYGPCDNSTDQRIDFPIDGPGGEIIEGVDVQQTEYLQIRGFRNSYQSRTDSYISPQS